MTERAWYWENGEQKRRIFGPRANERNLHITPLPPGFRRVRTKAERRGWTQ